jgi:segregation and condensation protein A
VDDGTSAMLQVGGWRGSLQELVAAMEAGTVPAADVPLREVVAAARNRAQDLEAASAAWVLAARAIERKARALLPNPPAEPAAVEEEGEAEATRLAERIAAYQAYAEAAAALRAFEERRRARFGRAEAAARAVAGAAVRQVPAAPASVETVERLLAAFAEVWERARPRTAEVARDRWTVVQAVEGLRRRLQAAGTLEFAELFSEGADRLEVVVTFLALLELVRLGEAAVTQQAPFAPLRIAWTRAGGGAGEADGTVVQA